MKRSYGLTVLLLTAFLYFNLQAIGETLPGMKNASGTAQVETVASAAESPEDGIETEKGLINTDAIEDISLESADNEDDGDIAPVVVPDEINEKTAEDNDLDADALTEPDVETDTKVQSASEAGDADIKLTDDTGDTEVDTATETEPEAEPEAPDPFAAEPYAQSSLKDIEEFFISNHELAEKSAEFSERALAIIAGSSEDRNFRRQCEFLTRAANHNVYAAGLALIVMPRLLEVSNLVVENSIKTLMNTFTDELISEPLARGIRLSELGNHLNSQAELAKLLRQLSVKIDDFCDQTELQNSRRHVQGRIPEFLRAVNRDMVVLIIQQREQLDRLLNQLDQHLKFCQINLEYFLAVSDHAPAVMQGSQIGRILRSCLDFAVSLRNYRKEYKAFAYRYSFLIKARLTDIEKLVGSNSRRNARIAAFTGNFPVRDRDEMPEKDFSAVETLQQTLRLLDAMREQSDRLMRDESSSISADNPIAPEAFEQLKSELSRHLNSTSWPIKKLIELKEPVYYESESPLATDVADVENN